MNFLKYKKSLFERDATVAASAIKVKARDPIVKRNNSLV